MYFLNLPHTYIFELDISSGAPAFKDITKWAGCTYSTLADFQNIIQSYPNDAFVTYDSVANLLYMYGHISASGQTPDSHFVDIFDPVTRLRTTKVNNLPIALSFPLSVSALGIFHGKLIAYDPNGDPTIIHVVDLLSPQTNLYHATLVNVSDALVGLIPKNFFFTRSSQTIQLKVISIPQNNHLLLQWYDLLKDFNSNPFMIMCRLDLSTFDVRCGLENAISTKYMVSYSYGVCNGVPATDVVKATVNNDFSSDCNAADGYYYQGMYALTQYDIHLHHTPNYCIFLL